MFYRVLSLFIGGNARKWPKMARNGEKCQRKFTKARESSRKSTFATETGKKAILAKVIAKRRSLRASCGTGKCRMALRHKAAHGSVRHGTHAFCRPVFGKTRRVSAKHGVLSQWRPCESVFHKKVARKGFQATDLAESGSNDAWTPSDAVLTHRKILHDAGTTLSTHFHDARCGGAPKGLWAFTHGEGLDTRRDVSDSRSLTVRQLTHS